MLTILALIMVDWLARAEALRPLLIVLGVLMLNALLASLVWWVVGAKQRTLRMLGRGFGGFFCLANLSLAIICFLRMLQRGGNWFYGALFVLALIFAFRFGGATAGRYP
jgi:hypothetical protein